MFAQLALVKPVRQTLVCFSIDTEVKVVGMASVQRGTSHMIGLNNFLNIFFLGAAPSISFSHGNRSSLNSFNMDLAM